jgi:hypothetical protein
MKTATVMKVMIRIVMITCCYSDSYDNSTVRWGGCLCRPFWVRVARNRDPWFGCLGPTMLISVGWRCDGSMWWWSWRCSWETCWSWCSVNRSCTGPLEFVCLLVKYSLLSQLRLVICSLCAERYPCIGVSIFQGRPQDFAQGGWRDICARSARAKFFRPPPWAIFTPLEQFSTPP